MKKINSVRDDFITINWDNIMAGMEYNFLKYDLSKISHLGASYDTCSVMHYGAYAFSKVESLFIINMLKAVSKFSISLI